MYHQRFKSEEERFAEKYEVAESGCWEWKITTGYPRFLAGGVHQKAHRYIWQKVNGVLLTPEQHVCHSCDNSKCVNPDHLFLGTHRDNMRDKAAKGRTFRPMGALNGRAKGTRTTVEKIRRLYAKGNVSQQSLADRFRLSQAVVSQIIRRETWK